MVNSKDFLQSPRLGLIQPLLLETLLLKRLSGNALSAKPFPQGLTTAVTYFRHSALIFRYFGGILLPMSWRRVAYGLLLAAGIAVLVLLIMPAVHVPFIVVHGPVSALRAQRSAWLFSLLLQAMAFLLAGVLPLRSAATALRRCSAKHYEFTLMPDSLALRC